MPAPRSARPRTPHRPVTAAARLALVALLVLTILDPVPAVTAAGAVGAATPRAALPSPLTDPDIFRDPPVATRPGMRWWWTTPYDVEAFDSEVAAMADAGFGSAEIAFNADGYGDALQRDALQRTVAAAARDGLRVDITMGPAWPLTNRGTAPETGLSQQELDMRWRSGARTAVRRSCSSATAAAGRST